MAAHDANPGAGSAATSRAPSASPPTREPKIGCAVARGPGKRRKDLRRFPDAEEASRVAGTAGDLVLKVRTTTGDVMHEQTAVGEPPAGPADYGGLSVHDIPCRRAHRENWVASGAGAGSRHMRPRYGSLLVRGLR